MSTDLGIGEWITLQDGSHGQVWSESPAGYWVAVSDPDGQSRWAEVTPDGRELGYSVMASAKRRTE